jgi:hypothetical protein
MTIILELDPAKLKNPDLDLRYVLPDILVEKSAGLLSDGGYDYSESKHLLLFLKTTDPDRGLTCVLDVIQHQIVLENHLAEATSIFLDDASGSLPKLVFPPIK